MRKKNKKDHLPYANYYNKKQKMVYKNGFFPSRKTQKNTTTTLLQKNYIIPFVNIFNGFKTFAS